MDAPPKSCYSAQDSGYLPYVFKGIVLASAKKQQYIFDEFLCPHTEVRFRLEMRIVITVIHRLSPISGCFALEKRGKADDNAPTPRIRKNSRLLYIINILLKQ